jgi:Uma2 family endonuclease
MATLPEKRLITVSEYYSMAESGILPPDERVELIEGEIYRMAPIGNRHVICVNRLTQCFSILGATKRVILSVQNPVRLSNLSEPQPDLTLFSWAADFYRAAPASPADVLLLVEVADTSLDFDQRIKLPLYAENGIPEVWIVDLPDDFIDVHRSPQAGRYSNIRRVRRGERLSPSAFPDLDLDAAQILG